MCKRLSVIIVSYQNIDCLIDCLDSINKFNDIGEQLEVIVSDNSENYDLYIQISHNYKWVKIIKNKNLGFGYANNRGAEEAQGDYLFFLNPDTILVEPIFKNIIDIFEKNQDLGLFGIQLLSKNRKKNISYYSLDRFGIFSTLTSKIARMLSIYIDGKFYISGADLITRKSSFYEAGRFDEKIFMYYEEPDLIKRIKIYSKASKTAFFKQYSLIHLEGGTQGIGSNSSPKSINRAMDTLKYYCVKWNINLNKVTKDLIRYQKLKYLIAIFLIKPELAKNTKDIINIYKSYLE